MRPTAIQKLLEIIDRVRLYPPCSFATALDSDINQTTGSGGHLSMWENRCMHAAVCLLRAGQPRSAGDAAKLGQFVGQFSWVTGDPIGLKGLMKNGGHFAFWPGGTSKQFSKILKKIPVLYNHIWHILYPLSFGIIDFDFFPICFAPPYYPPKASPPYRRLYIMHIIQIIFLVLASTRKPFLDKILLTRILILSVGEKHKVLLQLFTKLYTYSCCSCYNLFEICKCL